MCEKMHQGSFFMVFEKLDHLAGDSAEGTVKEIKSGLKDFCGADAIYDHLEEAYVRLFVSHFGGVQAPLYESCYVGTETGAIAPLMGAPALAMKKRLQEKGLSIGSDVHDPADHISIELEYLYFLLEKGWREGDPQFIREAANFAAQIMVPWVSKLQNRLAGEVQCRFYPLWVSLLLSILGQIAKTEQAPASG
jgi:TorA maturation chaperone TorD